MLGLIEGRLQDGVPKPQGWPKRAAEFGEAIRRVAPALRAEGIGVETRKSNGRRVLHVWHLTVEEVKRAQQSPVEDEEERELTPA